MDKKAILAMIIGKKFNKSPTDDHKNKMKYDGEYATRIQNHDEKMDDEAMESPSYEYKMIQAEKLIKAMNNSDANAIVKAICNIVDAHNKMG